MYAGANNQRLLIHRLCYGCYVITVINQCYQLTADMGGFHSIS